MRNLKRALSLTLASVMLLGMMVVGAGAAGYKDVTDGHNVEAIEVLQAVGAMVGDEAGNFDPDANVNRAQIATIMSRLLDLKVEDFNAADIPFTDVPEWAVPFVAACYADGITSGVSATAYGSNNSVTAAQAALMMMKALGYFQYQDDFGDDWQLATIKQASEIGLFNGITVDRTSALTRNDVAQMALNALKSNMVSFTGEVGSVYEVNGASIRVGYKPEYTIKTSADPIYNRIDNLATTIDKPTGQYEMQLGEYLYAGKLTLTSTVDVFGRPARYWELDGEEIGTYVKEELLKTAYTTSVTGKTLYDLLGSTTVKDYDFEITIDGVSDPTVFDGFDPKNSATNKNEYWPLFNKTYLNRNNDANVGATGNGVLTQVFIDTNDKTVYIAVINTYLAFASEDYDEKNDLVDLEVHGITEIAGHKGIYAKASDSEQITVTAEEFDVASVADGDCFLVTVADGAIQSMRDPDVLSAVEISSFSKNSSLTTGGTKYDYASSLYYDPDTLEAWTDGKDQINLKDKTYNVYLDQYGYAIGVEEVESPDNYVFITGVNGNYNNLINVNVEANAIFLDGTMETISINGRKSVWVDSVSNEKLDLDVDAGATINRWFTYTKGSNGVYTVKLVDYGVKGLGQFHEDRDGEDVYGNGATPVDYKYHNVMVYDNKDRYETPVTDEKVVYSNDKTVFLTASVAELQTKAGVFSTVIDDVDGVAVGIDNVDITPWAHETVKAKTESTHSAGQHNNTACIPHPTTVKGDNCNLSYGTYSLYNSKGYIIAMVVVGEDNGMADNLVYVDSGDVKSESYDKATEKWTWVRNAIVNGERVELVEVNDTGISLLEEMEPHHWYRVNYNANGEVTKVRSHKHTAPVPDWCYDNDTYGGYGEWGLNTGSYRYVHQYNVPNNAIYDAITTPGVDVVLYHQQHFQVTPVNDGHTLYMVTDKEQASGIRYTEDTNIVFIQTERNKSYTEFWKGENGVKKALKALHPLDKYDQKVSYGISALWKDGRATTIIIRDLNVQGQDGEWGQVRTGNVYFDATDSLDWAARMLAIYNERADITDQGRGRFYFELTGINGFDIHDGRPAGTGYDNDTILYRYKVYVNEEKDKNQVGREQTGVLYPIAGKPNHYWAEVPELPHTFNVDEELFIVITEVLNGIPNMPTRTNGTMPGNMDQPKIGGDGVPGSIGPAYPGQKVGFEIPVVTRAARAAGDRVEGNLVEGQPYRVEINGNTANPDPVYLVSGKLSGTYTITSEDIRLGELVITGIYESEEGGTTPPTDPSKPVSSVTVSPAVPASVKVGADLTFKVTSTGATGSVKVDTSKAGTVDVTLTVTTDNAKGFAAGIEVKDWTVAKYTEGAKTLTLTTTVKVESDGGPASGDIKVTIKPDENNEGQYIFTVDASGNAPTDPEVVDAINAELKKQGIDITVETIMNTTEVWSVDGKVGTLKKSVSYNVYVNGTLAGTVKDGTFTQGTNKLDGFLTLMKKDGPAIAKAAAVTTDVAGNLTASDIEGLSITEDLYLVNAYELAIGATSVEDSVTWTAGKDGKEQTATISTAPLFPEGAIVTVTGKGVTPASNKLTLTVGKTYTESKDAAKDATKWTFTLGASMVDGPDTNKVTVTEKASNEVSIKIGNKTITTDENVGADFNLPYDAALIGKYILVTKDGSGKPELTAGANDLIAIEAASKDGKMVLAVDALTGTEWAEKDGPDYTLLPVGKVNFADTSSMEIQVSYGTLREDALAANTAKTLFAPVGADITIVKASATATDKYQIFTKVGAGAEEPLGGENLTTYKVVATKDDDSDVPTISLKDGITEVIVTANRIGTNPANADALKTAVKGLVTANHFNVEAETTVENPNTVLATQNVKYTITLTPASGYYFHSSLTKTSTTECAVKLGTDKDNNQIATFDLVVTKGW